MALWNITDDDNDIGRLMAMILPNANGQREMLDLTAEQLSSVETYAGSLVDGLNQQQAALADLLACADHAHTDPATLCGVAWAMREIAKSQEFFLRASSMARALSEPESRALHERMIQEHGLETRRA